MLKRKIVTHCAKIKKVEDDVHAISVDQPPPDGAAVVSDQLDLPTSIPADIQNGIQQFTNLFQELTSLPPFREYDHYIPLVPGSQLVNVRPYKYVPHQKTEIEKQVEDMLKKGIIQKSVSSFASSILLVKKKYESWHFCVDYRHLIAITVKDKHPLPIVD